MGKPPDVSVLWLGAGLLLLVRQLDRARGFQGTVMLLLAAALLAAVVLGYGGGGLPGASALLGLGRGGAKAQEAAAAAAKGAGEVLEAAMDPTHDRPRDEVLGDLYTMRGPRRGLTHLSLRRELTAALTRLRPFAQHSRGALTRAVAALEDFYARYDAALAAGGADGGALARRSARTLLDTRTAALNALHELGLSAVDPGAEGDAEAARALARSDTLRCLGVLARKHGGRDGALRAEALLPPYPWDPHGRRATELHY